MQDLDFLTEPLEGYKASYILKNPQRFRDHFLAKAFPNCIFPFIEHTMPSFDFPDRSPQ
jgi:hypothetical protein